MSQPLRCLLPIALDVSQLAQAQVHVCHCIVIGAAGGGGDRRRNVDVPRGCHQCAACASDRSRWRWLVQPSRW